MQARTQTLRSKRSEADGWHRIMFSQFKERPGQPDVKRVERILSLLVAAERYSREHECIGARLDRTKGASDALSWAHQHITSKNAYVRTLEQIDKALQRYRWRAMVSEESDKGHFQYELYCVANPGSRWGDWESAIVSKLLKLSEKPEQVSRFRRCSECHEWFYGITGHQQFCGEPCRRRHAAENPDFKEKRRTYMRERYRPLQKELQERSLAAASGSRQRKGRE